MLSNFITEKPLLLSSNGYVYKLLGGITHISSAYLCGKAVKQTEVNGMADSIKLSS